MIGVMAKTYEVIGKRVLGSVLLCIGENDEELSPKEARELARTLECVADCAEGMARNATLITEARNQPISKEEEVAF